MCGSLEEKTVESRAEDGGLACEVAEGSKDSTRPFCVKNLWCWSAGAQDSAVINKKLEVLKESLCFTGMLTTGAEPLAKKKTASLS